MRINGLKMYNYWLVNFAFSFTQYMLVMTVFFLTGYYLSELTIFTDTDPIIILLVYVGWGLNQVTQAFFLSVFLNDSQTASMIGYMISIVGTIVGSTLNVTGIACGTMAQEGGGDYKMKSHFYFHPAMTYAHSMFFLSNECAWEKCIDRIELLPPHVWKSIIALYIQAAVYGILGIYLNEVVPQAFGVAQHPLYFLSGPIRRLSPRLHKRVFGGPDAQLASFKDDSELVQEDEDTKRERKDVHALRQKEYANYPLIAKDIRKIYPGSNGRPPKVANKNVCLRVNPGEFFGLLGPNGAGKTTLISQLSGLYPATNGNAWIGGL